MSQFSIVIPCYNCAKTLGATLESIVDQHLGDKIEVIIVDDCSTEPFDNVISEYNDKLKITTYKTEHNLGPGRARQFGVDHATGDWIVFCDHDDTFIPNTFNRVRTIIRNNPSRNILQTRFYEVQEDGTQPIPYTFDRAANWTHGKFFRRKFLVDNNLTFSEKTPTHEDVYFSILTRMATNHFGAPILQCDLFTYNWFNRPESLSHRRETGLDLFESHFEDYVESAFGPIRKLSNVLDKNEILTQGLSAVLFIYFYSQGFMQLGRQHHERDLQLLTDTIIELLDLLDMPQEQFVGIIYQNPQFYWNIRQESFNSVGPFFEFDNLSQIIMSTKETVTTEEAPIQETIEYPESDDKWKEQEQM